MGNNNSDLMVFNNSQILSFYLATAIAEGFCEGEGASREDQLKAWAYLIKTGKCWRLQGWFGRNAMNFINNNIISKKGEINWDRVDELTMEGE